MYWLVSLPGEDDAWRSLQDLSAGGDLSKNYKFAVPAFRVGTLDSLLGLSDDLAKVNAAVEGTVNKVRRQLYEVQSSGGGGGDGDGGSSGANVEGSSPETYLQRFAWQEAKYPSRRALAETVAAITDTTSRLDDELKRRTAEYSSLRASAAAANRKATGSLAVRDVSDLVPAHRLVSTEHLVTLLVVLSRGAQKDFLDCYETLTEYVVPRSAARVADDAEHAVYSVVVFRRIAEDFRVAARSAGFVVRDANDDAEAQAASVTGGARVRGELETARASLEDWASVAYSEAFSAWIHVLTLRLFVESILRYGLPPKFTAALLRPNPKTVPKLRKALAARFAGVGSEHFSGEGGLAEGEMFPYVSFALNVEEYA